MKNSFILLITCLLALFSSISCTNEDTLAATDNSQVVASVSIDLINELDIKTGNEISFIKLTSKKSSKTSASSCAIITMNPETSIFPKTFYVDFGTGCSSNGVKRKGKLKITFSNPITTIGSTMSIERENYYVNGNKVEGKIIYKNTTENLTIPQWTRTVKDGVFTDTNGKVYVNSGSHTVKQTAGFSTLALDDNTYEMTEGTHKVQHNGGTMILTVSEALIKNYNCDYISKGKLKVESAILDGTIDYGDVDGQCDNNAIYTHNGIVFPFTM